MYFDGDVCIYNVYHGSLEDLDRMCNCVYIMINEYRDAYYIYI